MTELFAGIAGGVGLLIAGMWFLTENLKTLAGRRLRWSAGRWTANRFSALLWGFVAGGITQSMTALTFIVVSILRSGLIGTRSALALILGGCVGGSLLVVIVTLDIKVIALFLLGLSGAVMASEYLSKFRPIAASIFGGAMLILGLVLLKDAAAPLAQQPWFRDMLEGTGNSLMLAFLVAALLTAILQSANAVCVFGIGLATVGVFSIDQAIMVIYGSCLGSSVILYLLSAGLRGRSRQVAMYMVFYDVLICVVLVPLLYCELYFDIPLMKALVLSVGLDLDQQLALVYVLISVLPLPVMLAGLGWSATLLERLWPSSQSDSLSRPRFIHDHASVDVDTSLPLVDLEQRRLVRNLSQYFEAVRRSENLEPLRYASRRLLDDISDFLGELQTIHPAQGAEDRNSMQNRQRLLSWLEDALGILCDALAERPARPVLNQFRTRVRESVDSVLLSLIDAMESDDRMSWDIAKRLTGDRTEMMRKVRAHYMEADPPLREHDLIDVLAITNAVEGAFFVLSKVEQELNPYSGSYGHVPLVRPARRSDYADGAGSATITQVADRPGSPGNRLP
ncbi:MAG: Na/Pi symporter [bacterium]|nr:Na/Pi symporter [bacterium]MDE0415910.1 Na/Pi symporter [bacterium]